MLSEKLLDKLGGLVFPRKLWLLASSEEVESIRWARNGTTLEIDSVLLCVECFHPKIFNVKSNQHVLRQLSYYKFDKLDQKKKLWEFKHQNFLPGREDLLPLIKRTPQRLPKKYANDVERRSSTRIRSHPSKRKVNDSDTEEDPDYQAPKKRSRKSTYKEEETYGDCCFRNNLFISGNPAKCIPKRDVAVRAEVKPILNGSVPVKRKRGRPRKYPLKENAKGILNSKVPDVGGMEARSVKEYSKEEISEIPLQNIAQEHGYSNFNYERSSCNSYSGNEKKSIDTLPAYITEQDSREGSVTFPVRRYFKRENQNGLIENCFETYYNDVGGRVKMIDICDRFEVETYKIDLPSTPAEIETISVVRKSVSRNENNVVWQPFKEEFDIDPSSTYSENEDIPAVISISRSSNSGRSQNSEGWQLLKRQCCFDEERLCDGKIISARYPDQNVMSKKESYLPDPTEEMYPTTRYLPFHVRVDEKLSSKEESMPSSSDNKPASPPLQTISDWESRQQAAAISRILYVHDNYNSLPSQYSIRPNSCNKLDQVYFTPDASDGINPPYISSDTNEVFPSYDTYQTQVIESNPVYDADFKSQEPETYVLMDLDNNCKQNMKNALGTNKVRKVSQSWLIEPSSSNCQKPNATPLSLPDNRLECSKAEYCLPRNGYQEKETERPAMESEETSEKLASVPKDQEVLNRQLIESKQEKLSREKPQLFSPNVASKHIQESSNQVAPLKENDNIGSSDIFRQDSPNLPEGVKPNVESQRILTSNQVAPLKKSYLDLKSDIFREDSSSFPELVSLNVESQHIPGSRNRILPLKENDNSGSIDNLCQDSSSFPEMVSLNVESQHIPGSRNRILPLKENDNSGSIDNLCQDSSSFPEMANPKVESKHILGSNRVLPLRENGNIDSRDIFRQDPSTSENVPGMESAFTDKDYCHFINILEDFASNPDRPLPVDLEDLEIISESIKNFESQKNSNGGALEGEITNREQKPLNLIKFLNDRLESGIIYCWDSKNNDIVIKHCYEDFVNWTIARRSNASH
ncbi:hypothetical protein JTE90_000063 [Oedothorax gibbosus]|uniref:HSF-type DNA-binding domain-containing protein n=1 Tax=Oedothorax gibbosus TaxID=931172 RepID=A0AAV6UDC0_9ARAC|nr:hypothetical protein JTE90_000063 [Oedothorax gibbosus]